MSNLKESPFLLLNGAFQLRRRKNDPSVAIPAIELVESREATIIKRTVTSFELRIQKIFVNQNAETLQAKAQRNECDVVRAIQSILEKQPRLDDQNEWNILNKRVELPDTPSYTPLVGHKLNQAFAGIDIDDLFQKVLPECEGKLHQRPEIHLMVWRGVIKSLKAMHILGMVHGDAKPDNFCLNITKSWVKSDSNDEDGKFNEVDFSDIKAIDLGLTMLPLPQRESQANLCFVKFSTDNNETPPDKQEIMSYGASYDFKYLANYVEEYNQHNDEKAKTGTPWPYAFNLQASQPLPTSEFDHEKIKKTLMDLPTELRKSADNQGGRYNYLLSVIDDALGSSKDEKYSFARITGSSNTKIFPTGRSDSVLIPLNISELKAPEPVPTEPVIKSVTKHSLLMPFAMACLLLAGAGAYFLVPKFMDDVNRPSLISVGGTTPSVLPAIPKPAKTEPSVTEPTVMMKGLIDKNHPTFLKCTSVLPLVDQVIKGIQPLDDVNRGKLSAARGFCNLLLPREAPEHDELFVTKLSAGYYALLLNDLLAAEAMANDIILTDSKKFRGPLLRAAIRAKKGDDAGFIADLTLSVQNGLHRSELDDESPLYGALTQTDSYQQLRSKAKN
jgi:hypothetical protein